MDAMRLRRLRSMRTVTVTRDDLLLLTWRRGYCAWESQSPHDYLGGEPIIRILGGKDWGGEKGWRGGGPLKLGARL